MYVYRSTFVAIYGIDLFDAPTDDMLQREDGQLINPGCVFSLHFHIIQGKNEITTIGVDEGWEKPQEIGTSYMYMQLYMYVDMDQLGFFQGHQQQASSPVI